MTAQKKFIGIDLGGESGRVMVGCFDGHTIQLSEKHRFKTGGFKSGNTLRWNVDQFWEEIQRGLSLAATECLIDVAWIFNPRSCGDGLKIHPTTIVDREKITPKLDCRSPY